MNIKCIRKPLAMTARLPRGAKSAIALLVLVVMAGVAIPALAQQTKTTVTYVYTNAQGTPLAEADAQGNIIKRYTYRPYGTQQTGPTNAGPGYTGHVHDPDTGLVYMQQRYYNPTVGRFLSPDPIAPTPGNVFNFGRYTYGNDNPYRYTDPDGQSVLEFLAGLEYETWSAVTGNGFHGHRLLGALADGYNGEGAGVTGALMQDGGLVAVVVTFGAAAPEVGTAEAGSEVVGESTAISAADDVVAGLSKSARKGIRSLEKRITEHEQKLADFKANPTVRPGMEKQPASVIKKAQQSRIKHLEKEIETFKKNIKKLKDKN